MIRSIALGAAAIACALLSLSPETGVRASSKRPHFTDIAPRSAFSYFTNNHYTGRKYFQQPMCGGIGILDYDNDGRMDIFFSNGAKLPELKKTSPAFYNCLLRNRGDGTFEDVTAKAGIAGEHLDFSYGVAVGDYDNDGFPDIFISNTGKNTLYHNNGDGTFTDVTERSGLADQTAENPERAAAWFDYDNDGLLDLVVSNYTLWTPADDQPLHARRHGVLLPPANVSARCRTGCITISATANSKMSPKNRASEKSSARAWASPSRTSIATVRWTYSSPTTRSAIFCSSTRETARSKKSVCEYGVAYNDNAATVSAMGADAKDYDNDGFVDIFYNNLMGQTWALFRNQHGRFFRYASPGGEDRGDSASTFRDGATASSIITTTAGRISTPRTARSKSNAGIAPARYHVRKRGWQGVPGRVIRRWVRISSARAISAARRLWT